MLCGLDYMNQLKKKIPQNSTDPLTSKCLSLSCYLYSKDYMSYQSLNVMHTE